MKITRENLKNIVREAMVEENAYQEFFKKALEKTGKSIPDMSDEEKKAFFNKIDSAWKGKGEKKESVDMGIDEEAVVVSKRTPEGNIVSKLKEESINEGKKRFNTNYGVGKSKYVVNYHDGVKKHKDGSDFFDIKIFKNKPELEAFKKDLVSKGFVKESVNEGNKPKFKVGDMVKYKGAKVSAKVLKVMPTNWENGYLIQFQDNKKKEEAGESSLVKESTNERMGSDKGEVGNANFNNRLKAMRDDKNSVVAFIDTNKGKKLLKVFKTQQTAQQFTKKNMDKLLNTKGVESVGTMPKKEWDAKEAKYAIESVNEAGVNVWYFYKKANKDKNTFFKMLSDFRKKHSDTQWIKMLNYALEDFNENPTKYKTIDDKQNILFKNLQTNKKVYTNQ